MAFQVAREFERPPYRDIGPGRQSSSQLAGAESQQPSQAAAAASEQPTPALEKKKGQKKVVAVPPDTAERKISPEVRRRAEIILHNLDECLGMDAMLDVLSKRDPKIYWGTATTGAPHIAYFVPMSKIADFLRAGCEVTILFADLHAYLDNMKAPWDLLTKRTQYYEFIIKSMLEVLSVPLEKLRFVRGTSYQLEKDYTLDVYKLTSIVTEHYARKAGAEVVKQVSSPALSGLLYPLLQALDEQYLGVDGQFGGVDQRKIFTFAEKFLPHESMNYKKRFHLMNPMVPGLTGNKMSSSEASSKIDILDSPEQIKEKIRGAFCKPGNVTENGVLAFMKMVMFPIFKVKGKTFLIERDAKNGGNVEFKCHADLEAAFASEQLHPLDLKTAVTRELIALLKPIRDKFTSDRAIQRLADEAYPALAQQRRAAEAAAKQKAAGKKGGKGGKGAKGAKGGKKKKGAARPMDPSILDLRVGVFTSVEVHPKADNLYVCKVDVGDSELRQVVCGFAKSLSVDQVLGKRSVVLCNLKSSNFKGVASQGMVLAATNGEEKGEIVELIAPPDTAAAGTRVTVPGFESADEPDIINPKKKEFPTKIAPDMGTDGNKVANYKGKPFTTTAGVCTAQTLQNAKIK